MTITKRYAIYALIVIFFANFLSYLDRQVVSGLEKQLKAPVVEGGMGLTKGEFGALWTAFTIGYMVFAPVVGFLTDRTRRTWVFAVCVFLWSLATLWSGWATTKLELFSARFFIGIGEAGCLVIGPTLIADYFAKQARGRALSVFFLGLPLGGTAGYIVAGIFTEHFGGWRHAFYAAGLPGIALAGVIALLVDPPRGGEDSIGHGHIRGIKPYLELLQNRTLLLITLAQAFAVIILVPILHYGVGFFEDKHGMKPVEATRTIGIIALIAGALGNSLSGVIGDRLARRRKGAWALLAGIAYLLGMPCLLFGVTTPSKELMVPALTLGAFCLFLSMPAVNTQIANCVSPKQRAMAYALAVFILHLLGDTAAPPVFGAVAEALSEKPAARVSTAHTESGEAEEAAESHRAGDPIGTQRAFTYFSFSMLLASACCFLAARTARRDEELAGAASSGDPAPAPALHYMPLRLTRSPLPRTIPKTCTELYRFAHSGVRHAHHLDISHRRPTVVRPQGCGPAR